MGALRAGPLTDPLTGQRTVVVGARQDRPNLPPAEGCPFCVGGVEAPAPYDVLAFPNRWPPLPDGRAEVVLYAPEHDASLGSLGAERVRRVVELWSERTVALGGRPDVDYVLVFENRGAEVGATIPHPHGQIYALHDVPPAAAVELDGDGGTCAVCVEEPGDRLVASAGGWRAWVPAAATWPYGLVLAPDDHVPDLPAATGGFADLAALLVDVFGRLDRLFDAPMPLMWWWHQRPTDGGDWPAAHLHAHVAPLLRGPGVARFVAAGELGSGLFFNPVVPTEAAAQLRGAVKAFAPGRVNLIGEHTDYTGGLVLPMAVHLGTTVTFTPGGDEVRLRSGAEPIDAVVPLDVTDPALLEPAWARYVAGVVAEVRPARGGRGTVATTLPVGAGLSSSAALEVAVALALGFGGPAADLARACQRAEQRASGVPCGIMDQLASAAGVAGHALLIDCRTEAVTPIVLPEGVEVVAVHSGEARALAGSAYAERRADCEAAAALVGPLRDADPVAVAGIADDRLRRRARHVVTENARVLDFVAALSVGDLVAAGSLLAASHASLRDDFDVSTPTLDALVERLSATRGVHGARLTGAGFGGCVVALTEPGALDEGWRLEPAAGAGVSPD